MPVPNDEIERVRRLLSGKDNALELYTLTLRRKCVDINPADALTACTFYVDVDPPVLGFCRLRSTCLGVAPYHALTRLRAFTAVDSPQAIKAHTATLATLGLSWPRDKEKARGIAIGQLSEHHRPYALVLFFQVTGRSISGILHHPLVLPGEVITEMQWAAVDGFTYS